MKKMIIGLMLGISTLGFSQDRYYDDYRSSIISFNWDKIASYLGLNHSQLQEIRRLNNRYTSYNSWNRVYRNDPRRWYQDRYFAMQRIMTPEQYKRFYNRYYKGIRPNQYYGSKHYYKDLAKKRKKYFHDKRKREHEYHKRHHDHDDRWDD
ncbi:hypothetical protein [Elizabethkingia sp. JS20170427COW]|uniref:hypothetical protein n=1 Tax=Elizabethkingia sp. JS20170427COW TaxID=2583851 RepID=UPI0011104A9A|nr:hypothetical protein [Elizabethkingia sp. JS20170427COW]QCX53360.1 hypothetical protein FGE20_06225 [Elizabethkingia sp. JS20170427COW]